jgi:hypothetical protein
MYRRTGTNLQIPGVRQFDRMPDDKSPGRRVTDRNVVHQRGAGL